MTGRALRATRQPPPLGGGSGKDLLTIGAIPASRIVRLLRLARELKTMRQRGRPHQYLTGTTLGLLFEKPSTRTRVSFEAGITQLGGKSLFLSATDIQLCRGESIADTARVLSRYLDGLVIRTYDHATVEEWARQATIPVINGLTDVCHPCQALSDLLTIREKKGALNGVKLAYVGDGNNVANSLIEGAAKMGMAISLGCPSGYEPDQRIVDLARVEAEHTGGAIEVGENTPGAGKEGHGGYTHVLGSLGGGGGGERPLRAPGPDALH